MCAPAPTPADRALWPLPLLAGPLPMVATLVAFLLSIRLVLASGCNPFIEGCVSISRAARHVKPDARRIRGLLESPLTAPLAVEQMDEAVSKHVRDKHAPTQAGRKSAGR